MPPVNDDGQRPHCCSCGNVKHASKPCMFCSNKAECVRNEALGEFETWCCSACYNHWSPDHRCIDDGSSDARVDECTFSLVWSKGVIIDREACHRLNEKLIDPDGELLQSRRLFKEAYLPKLVSVALSGPHFSRIHWICSRCKSGFLDAMEVPTKECRFCRYQVCSSCACHVKCSSAQCASHGRARGSRIWEDVVGGPGFCYPTIQY